MKVRHLDVFHRRRGFVSKAPDITDAVMPRTTLIIAGLPRFRNHLLGHVIKRYREVPDVSHDVDEDPTGRRQMHRVAFPYRFPFVRRQDPRHAHNVRALVWKEKAVFQLKSLF
jgi:hypothetical protein